MAATTPGNGGSGAGAGIPGTSSTTDIVDLESIANEAVNKALGPRLARFEDGLMKRFEAFAAKQLETLASKTQVPEAVAEASSGTAGTPAVDATEKLTLKGLLQQVEAEKKARLDLEKKLVEERQSGINNKMRSDVMAQFASKMGAESPHLKPYVNEYLSQFTHKDGGFFRKTTGEFGEESLTPLDKAVDDLFKNDLKHLLPARNAGLAPRVIPGAQGSPFLTQRPAPQPGVNPMMMEIAEGLAMAGRQDFAQQLLDSAAQGNGTVPQK